MKAIWKWLKIPVFLAVGVGLLVLALKDVDTAEIWKRIQDANFGWVAVSFLLGYLAIVSRGLRWNCLLEPIGHRAHPGRSVHAVAFGYFANLGIPRSGELARCTILNQSDDVPVDKLFGTVILERVIDTLMLGSLLGLAFVLNVDVVDTFFQELSGSDDPSDGGGSNLLWYLLAGAALGGILLLVLWKRIVPEGLRTKMEGFLKGILDGIKSISKLKQRTAFLFHTLFIWACYVGMSYVCVFAFEETSGLNLGDGLFLMVAGGLGMLAPAQGGLGAYHVAVKYAFIALGSAGVLAGVIPDHEVAEFGVTFAWLVWSSQTLMILLGGFIGYLVLLMHIRNKQAQA